MESINHPTIVGVFEDHLQATRAVDALHLAGFREDQIGFVRRGGETAAGTTHIVTTETHGSNIGTGAVIGGVVGAAAALLIPGVGPVLAGGILAHALGATAVGGAVVGAVGGAVAGGLVGGLTDMGVTVDDARYADEQFQAGRTIVTVKTDGRLDEARTILQRFGAHDVQSNRTGTTAVV